MVKRKTGVAESEAVGATTWETSGAGALRRRDPVGDVEFSAAGQVALGIACNCEVL